MKKPVIIMSITKEDVGCSAHTSIQNKFIGTEGEDFDELKNNILEAVNISFEDSGFVYTIDEIVLKPDIQSFFEFYKVINVKALSERTGMNQSLLAQYISGIKKPSANTNKTNFTWCATGWQRVDCDSVSIVVG